MNHKKRVEEILIASEAIEIKNGDESFTWTSGIKSPIYCDNRVLLSKPELRREIIQIFKEHILNDSKKYDVIAGVATAGIPWAAMIADELKLPMIFIRSEAKGHGKNKKIEGVLREGQSVLLIEDLISTGKSSLAAAQSLMEAGAICSKVMSIFSYGLNFASESFSKLDIEVQSLVDLPYLMESEVFTIHQRERLKNFWSELSHAL